MEHNQSHFSLLCCTKALNFFFNFSEFIWCQTHNVGLTEEVKRLQENEEEQQRALRALEQATTKMETEKIKQHAEAVRYVL